MADINEQNLAGAEQAAEALKAAAEAAETVENATEEKSTEPAQPAADFCDLAQQLDAATKKASENYDLYVRAVAEMENVRRRCAEDVQKAQKFSIEKFAQGLLPVVDSLEKAIEVANDGALKDGVLATYRQLVHALEVSGMKAIDPKEGVFDPNTQQAIAMVPPSDGHEPGHVAQVFQRGWMIHERVLRPAMVSVVQG